MRIRDAQSERRQARKQMAALGLMTTVVLGGAIWAKQSPADAVELRILVSELRSQAGELELIEKEQTSGKLWPAFVREHARQLVKINLISFRDLARLRVEQKLETEKRQAVEDGRELVAQVGALATGQSMSAPMELRHIRQKLQDRERALRP